MRDLKQRVLLQFWERVAKCATQSSLGRAAQQRHVAASRRAGNGLDGACLRDDPAFVLQHYDDFLHDPGLGVAPF